MKKILFLLAVFGMSASIAAADLVIGYPKIAKSEAKQVEVGTSPKITISYLNLTGKDAVISLVELHLAYDPTLVDNIIGINSENPALNEKDKDISAPGAISYKLLAPKPLIVPAGTAIDAATITLHVNQKAVLTAVPVNLINFSSAFRAKVLDPNIADLTGGMKTNPVALINSTPPDFTGLSKADSADQFGGVNPGNTLLLSWPVALSRAKYFNGKMNYRIFRNSLPSLTGAVELSPGIDHSPYVDPADRVPYVGNVPTKDNIFQDSLLSDGAVYYYIAIAEDDASPTPNRTPDSDIKIMSAVPLDLTPPGEVYNISTDSDNNKITLKWVNPGDGDFDGVIVLKNSGRPVGAGSLGSASAVPPYADGPLYDVGAEPFGAGQGKVVYISSAGETQFEDYQAENGVTSYYKLFTFDRAAPGPPREMGRNYSNGVAISRTAGLPPKPVTNFVVTAGASPGNVILSWNNSPDKFAAGVLVRYTTDRSLKFAALKDETTGEVLGVFPVTAGAGGVESIAWSLPVGASYYFKAYAFNQTAEDLNPAKAENMAKHLFGSGQAAAYNLVLGRQVNYAYNFQTGINYFAIPFPAENLTDASDNPVDVSTVEKLFNAINSQAGGNAVLSLGRWNAATQKAEGLVSVDYSKTGSERFFTSRDFSVAAPVSPGEPYVVSVSKPFTFTLKSVIAP